MNALVMLGVTLGVFLLLHAALPTLLALALSVVFLIAWFRFNMRAATKGLVRANLRAYFVTRARGGDHGDALFQMVASRYPFDQQRATRVLVQLATAAADAGPRDQLRSLVFAVFVEENGRPPAKLGRRMLATIESEIDRQSSLHGVTV